MAEAGAPRGWRTPPDPLVVLDEAVEVFCRYWDNNRAVGRIYDAIPTDAETAEALQIRLAGVHALVADPVKRAAPDAGGTACRDAADVMAVLNDLPCVMRLSATRNVAQLAVLPRKTCRRILADISEILDHPSWAKGCTILPGLTAIEQPLCRSP